MYTATENKHPLTIVQSCMKKIYGAIENELDALRQSQAGDAIHPSCTTVMCAIYQASGTTTYHVEAAQFCTIPLCVGVRETHAMKTATKWMGARLTAEQLSNTDQETMAESS